MRTSDVSGMWVPDRPSKTVWLAERTSKALRNSQFQAIIVAAFCLGPESELVIFSLLLKKQFGMWHDWLGPSLYCTANNCWLTGKAAGASLSSGVEMRDAQLEPHPRIQDQPVLMGWLVPLLSLLICEANPPLQNGLFCFKHRGKDGSALHLLKLHLLAEQTR